MRDTAFIAMSNYYYDEKKDYLTSLNTVSEGHHDLTSFLRFGLRGVALQSQRLAFEIRDHVSKEIFRSFAHDLFTRLVSPKKTVIARRQLSILEMLLRVNSMDLEELVKEVLEKYKAVKNPRKAIIRDLVHLLDLGAIQYVTKENQFVFSTKLEWPSVVTEGQAFEAIKKLPKAKTRSFLAGSLP